MDNGKLRIDNIFNGKTYFSIPDYQRSYAWEEKQLILNQLIQAKAKKMLMKRIQNTLLKHHINARTNLKNLWLMMYGHLSQLLCEEISF